MLQLESLAVRFKEIALECGFDLAGIASAAAPPQLGFLREWIERGYAGEMTYLAEQVARRSDLQVAFPWARSVLAVGLQYDTGSPCSNAEQASGGGWISRYAWGDDYHDLVKSQLETLRERLHQEAGDFESRVYVDTGPVAEKAYAAAAGLGAYGKNTCLLNPEHGSWFFLGVVITSLELPPDAPVADLCGSCTACLEVCPTGALVEPYVLDATRCTSYLTIEIKGAIPEQHREGVGRHVFGCDLCQDVCPWNRKRRHRGPEALEPRGGQVAPALEALATLDEEGFRQRFRNSPIKRTKRRGLLRNVAVALGNAGGPEHLDTLERLSSDPDAVVREHAQWARKRLEARLANPPAHPTSAHEDE